MLTKNIRAVVRGIIRNGEKILVSSEAWPSNDNRFYLPPGGSIEYGEYGKDAIIREIKEELESDIENVRYLGMIENMFENPMGLGHEIVLVFEADLVDKSLYSQTKIIGCEAEIENSFLYGAGPITLKFHWKSLEEMKQEGFPLYPEGVDKLLTQGL
jgi:ADP-ribose pyrophosphatase YjhB (NUDIX family)